VFTIVGSGFGLYGYLPAILQELGDKVILPEEYLSKVRSRRELKELEKDIFWVKNKELAIKKATKVIFTVPPNYQYKAVKNLFNDNGRNNVQTIFLEKPVATSPIKSIELLELLESKEVDYVIGYSFLYLDLDSNFNTLVNSSAQISWQWSFMAHHFSMDLKNWKRYHSSGGGVLRFYGIHIIAFLSKFGYDNVKESTLTCQHSDEPFIWSAKFLGGNLPPCNVTVNCKSKKDVFNIISENIDNSILLNDPFSLLVDRFDGLDKRVPMLASLLKDEMPDKKNGNQIYKNINSLWEIVENISIWRLKK
jgi:hypothetical protein